MKTSFSKFEFLFNATLFLALLGGWEVLTRWQWVPSYLIPGPMQILQSLFEYRVDYLNALAETASHSLMGMGMSLLVGFALAILAIMVPIFKRLLLPLSIFFQTVPIIAVAPLLVIYFGFGSPTVIASSFIVSLFPILANSLIGLESIPKVYIELFSIHQSSKFRKLIWLRIPYSYSQIIIGIRISLGLSIIGAIAGEFVGGTGLGSMIDTARTQQRVDIVFSCLILLSLLGLTYLKFLDLLNHCVLKWRPLGRA